MLGNHASPLHRLTGMRNAIRFCSFFAITVARAQVPCGNEVFEMDFAQHLPSGDRGAGDDTLEVLVVPVVFHIIHEGEPIGSGTNLSNAEIISSLACVNDGFRHVWGTGVDTRMEFCLATVDPNGVPTTGITRTNGTALFPAYVDGVRARFTAPCGLMEADSIIVHTTWSQTEYLNIWVFNHICGASGVGYSPIMSLRGVLMRYDYMECPPVSTLAHELGHACGLSHTFLSQDGPCPVEINCAYQGDRCCDTPPHNSVVCDNGGDPCDPDVPLELWYNTRYNLMSYCGGSYDQKRFTNDQRTLMRTTLRDNAPELLASGNCGLSTGLPPLAEHLPVIAVVDGMIRISDLLPGEVCVIDVSGRVVLRMRVNSDRATVDLRGAAPGIHLVTNGTAGGRRYCGRVFVQ